MTTYHLQINGSSDASQASRLESNLRRLVGVTDATADRTGSGRATRLRLCIETHARAPVSFLLPLLRPRFRRTMTRSLATIDKLLGQDNS